MKKKYQYDEAEYTELLELAQKGNWEFICYDEIDLSKRQIIWRHDVDLSPHRALALANIEKKLHIKATYFFHLHSLFYNVLEDGIRHIILAIVEMGHHIALHFDPTYYNSEIRDIFAMKRFMALEKTILQEMFNVKIGEFSFHNPTLTDFSLLDDDIVEGMINVSGRNIIDNFLYISDSRGGWRRRELPVILMEGIEPRLHVLTHPGRWTPEPMEISDALHRCRNGRNIALMQYITNTLEIAWRDITAGKKEDRAAFNIHDND